MPNVDAPADERRLVLRALAGDDVSFHELVVRHQARIRSLVRRSLGDADADDVSQEIFLKAWRKLSSLRDPDAFSGWLRQIAVRAVVDRIRDRQGVEIELEEEHGAAPDAPEAVADLRLDLQAAIARLTPAQRLCVLLVHGDGLSHREAAEEIGIPIGTVKSHIARATPWLRRWLQPENAA